MAPLVIRPTDDVGCTLAACPPGLFLFGNTLGFKTEYGAMEIVGPIDVPGDQMRWTVGNKPDAYVAASGEAFWGGATRHDDRAALIVQPVTAVPVVPPPNAPASRDEWQPIATAPRDGSWFFTKSNLNGEPSYDVARFDEKYHEFAKAGCGFSYVTHWRPAELAHPTAVIRKPAHPDAATSVIEPERA